MDYIANTFGQLGQQQAPSGGFWNSLLGNKCWSVSLLSPVGPGKDGWYDYNYHQPAHDALCQFKQYDDGEPWIGYADFSPEFNVAYLKWRLTGIAKEGL